VTQSLTVLVSPLLTRFYHAEDFGNFQVYLLFMTFAIVMVNLRYDQSIFLPEQEDVAANLVAVALVAAGIVSCCAAVLVGLGPLLFPLPRTVVPLRPFLWILPLSIAGAGLYQALSSWALRQKAYSRVTGTKVTQVVSMLAIQLATALVHSGPLGLLAGDAVGRGGGSLSLARLSWKQSREAFRSVGWKAMRAAASRYRDFPLVSTFSSLIAVAAYALPALLLAQFYGPKTLGWFALGDRVLGAPSILVGQAVSQVYSVEAANFSNSNPEALQALFFKLIKRLAILGVVPVAFFLAFAPSVFALVFGAQWREAGVYARLLTAMRYVALVASPFVLTLNILEKQVWQLAWDLSRTALTLTSILIVYRLGLSARWAIATLGGTILAAYIVHLLLCHLAIVRKIRLFRARVLETQEAAADNRSCEADSHDTRSLEGQGAL